jgi:hypothetical protein
MLVSCSRMKGMQAVTGEAAADGECDGVAAAGARGPAYRMATCGQQHGD